MSLDVHSCTHWLRPRNPPLPPHWDSYTRALLFSKYRWHLFATPWFPGSGSVSQTRRPGSGSFNHQAKIVRKTFISNVLWLLYDFFIFEECCHAPLKSNRQKKLSTKIYFSLVSWRSLTKRPRAGAGSGSAPKCHGSGTLLFSNGCVFLVLILQKWVWYFVWTMDLDMLYCS